MNLFYADSEIEVCYFTDCETKGRGATYEHLEINPSDITDDTLRYSIRELEDNGAHEVTVYIDHEIAYECGQWLSDPEEGENE